MTQQPIPLINVRVMTPAQRLIEQATANAQARHQYLTDKRARGDADERAHRRRDGLSALR